MTAAALVLATVTVLAQTADPTLWVTDGQVNAVVRDGNTIYVGGTFTQVGPATGGGAALSPVNGYPIQSFPRVTGQVWTVVDDGAGGWIIGGAFTAVGGLERFNLAHILADGSVADWAPNPNSVVRSLAVAGDKLYVCGAFTWIGMRWRSGLAAIDLSTGVANSWNPSVNGEVRTLTVDAGTLYLGGDFTTFAGQTRGRIAAVDVTNDGLLNWGPSFNSSVRAIAVSATTVYVGGEFGFVGGQVRNRLAALDRGNGAATVWNPSVNGTVLGLVARGRSIYVCGNFSTIGGSVYRHLAAIDSASATPIWSPDPNGAVLSVAVRGSTVYAAGEFTRIGGQNRRALAAVDSATGLAAPWDPSPGSATTYAVAANGNTIYAGGPFTIIGGVIRNSIAALDANTGIATGWNPSASWPTASSTVMALAVSGGTVYAGGVFQYIGGQGRNNVAALSAADGSATPWNPNTDGAVRTIIAGSDRVYIGGSFRRVGLLSRNGLAAVDPTSGAPLAWNPDAGSINAMVLSGGVLYVGGQFNLMGGVPRTNIAALDTINDRATTWNPGANGAVQALALSGNTLYASGGFSTIGGQSRQGLAALDATTGSATAWNPGVNGTVNSLVADAGAIYAGGEFTTIGGVARNRLAALDPVTGTATLWNPDANGYVDELWAGDGTVYAGGGFSTLGGQPQTSLAAITAAPGAPEAHPTFTASMSVSPASVAVGQPVTITAIVRNDGAASDDGRIVFSFKDLTDPSDFQRASSTSAGDVPGFRLVPRGSALLDRDCQPMTADYLVAEYVDSDWPGLGAETDTFRVTVRPRTSGVFSIDVRSTMRSVGGDPCDYTSAIPNGPQTVITDQQGWTVGRFIVQVAGTPVEADPNVGVSLSAQSITLGEELRITASAQNLGAISDDGRVVMSFPAFTDPGDALLVTSNAGGDAPGFRLFPSGSALTDTACATVAASYLVAEYADSSWQPIGLEVNSFEVIARPRALGTFTFYARGTMHTAGAAPCVLVNRVPVNGELGFFDQQGWPVNRYSVTVNPPPVAPDPSFNGAVTVSADSIILGETVTIAASVRNLGMASDDGRIVFSFPALTDTLDAQRVTATAPNDYPGVRILRAGSALTSRTCQPLSAAYLVAEYADNNWQWIGTETNTFVTVVTPRTPGDFVVDVRSTMHTTGGAACEDVNDLPANGQGGFTDQQGWAVKRFVIRVKPAPVAAEPAFLGPVSLSSTVIQTGQTVSITATVNNLGLHSDDGRIVFAFPSLTDSLDAERVGGGSGADEPGLRVLPAGASLLGRDCQTVDASYLVAEYADDNWYWIGRESNTLQLWVRPRVAGDFWVEVRATMRTMGAGPCDYVNGLPPNGISGAVDQQGWEVRRFLITVSPAPPTPVFPTGIYISAGAIDLGQSVTIIASARNDGAPSDDGRIVVSFPGLTTPADGQRIVTGTANDATGYRLLPAGSPLVGADCQPMTAGYLVAEYVDADWQGFAVESNACSLTVRPRLPGTFEILVRGTMHPIGAGPCAMVNATPYLGSVHADQQGWEVRRYIVTVNAVPAVAQPTFTTDVVVSRAVVPIGEPLTISAVVRNNGASSDDGRIVFAFPALDQAGDAQFVTSGSTGDAPGYREFPAGATLPGRDCQPVTAQYLAAEYVDAAWDSIGDETNTFALTVFPPREGLFTVEVRSTMRTAGAGPCDYVNGLPPNGQAGFTDQQGWSVRRFEVLVGSPSSISWRLLGNAGGPPDPRAAQAAVYDGLRDELVLYGGRAREYIGDSWALPLGNYSGWNLLQPGGPVPLRRTMHSMVCDPAGNLFIFGGFYDDYLNDLWVLTRSPVSWWFRMEPPGERPSPRLGHSAIYDPVRQRMLVVGGYDGTLLNDVWEYAPIANGTWRQLTPAGTPMPARANASAIYDPVRDRVLIFGGDGGTFRNDLWELRLSGGPAWNPITTIGAPPGPRREHTAIYHALRDEMVLFGGYSATQRLEDVWTLTLSGVPRWERRFTAGPSPSPRSLHSSVYDPLRHRMVTFGGQLGNSLYSNEVWELRIDELTPVALSLASVEAEADHVRLTWFGEGAASLTACVERSSEQGVWTVMGAASAQGEDQLVFRDQDVVPGTRYGYRLRVVQDGTEEVLAPVWVTVPIPAVLSLAGASPNPAIKELGIAFTLPAVRPGALELFDLRGRLVAREDLSRMEAGPHRIELARGRRLAAGVYLVRLTHGDRALTAKACVVR